MQLPKEISPNPILSAVIELRINSTLKEEDVLNFFYRHFQETFPRIKNLPIPNEVRTVVSSFKYSGDFILSNDKFSVRIGKNVIAFENKGEVYHLWPDYFDVIKLNLAKISSENFIKNIERVGCRYISLFENSSKLNEVFDLKLGFNTDDYNVTNQIYSFKVTRSNVEIKLQIAEDAQARSRSVSKKGVLIDIDAYQKSNLPSQIGHELFEIIDNLHSEEKGIFYHLIKEEYLRKNLNPKY